MDTQAWLRFANVQMPARLANAILDAFGAPEAAFTASPDDLAGAGFSDKQLGRLLDPSFIPTERQLKAIKTYDVRVLPRDHSEYPPRLRDIPDPPPCLFCRGSLVEKDRFAIAVVGSRHATPYGRSVAARISRDLARAGLTIVSGGAIGIDTAAHRGALDGGGRTIVVLGCGLDTPYPRENMALFDLVVESGAGAVLTEFPMGTAPDAWRFPQRNRIVSGMCMGVLVAEAGPQSGALITASVAAEQGRDVMAVPGNVDRPSSRGTNGLIRDGAALVEDATDVMRALGMLVLEPPPADSPRAAPAPAPNDPSQQRLLKCLDLNPRHIDAITAEAGLPPTEVSVHLTMLELAGLVRRLPGNCYIRAL